MDVLRQPVIINGRPFSVVGVASDGFTAPELGQPADIWLPIAALPAINTAQAGWLDERGTWWLRVIGRLEPGKDNATGRGCRRGYCRSARIDLPRHQQGSDGGCLAPLVGPVARRTR